MGKASAQGLGGASTGEADTMLTLHIVYMLQSTATVHVPVPLMPMFLVDHSDWLLYGLAPLLLASMYAFSLPFNPYF